MYAEEYVQCVCALMHFVCGLIHRGWSSGTRVEWSSAVYALLTSGPSSRVKQEVPNVDTLSC